MTHELPRREIRMIPLDQIVVCNPRERNPTVFAEVVENIRLVGLKKPVTVTPRTDSETSAPYFLLVCGEGRMKAFMKLGEKTIPALVIEVSDEEALLMGLTENIARHTYRAHERLAGITQLSHQGYGEREIAVKTGLTQEYVRDLLILLATGNEHLVAAVDGNRIPLSAAIDIAGSSDPGSALQQALQGAYESGGLKGNKFRDARKYIQNQQAASGNQNPNQSSPPLTASTVVLTYQKEVKRQQDIVEKADATRRQLMFMVNALKQLLCDDHFATLLDSENLRTLPAYLAEQLYPDEAPHDEH